MVEEIILRAIRGLEHELSSWIKKLFHHYPHHPECRRYRKVYQVSFITVNKNKFIIMEKLFLSKGYHVNNALLKQGTNEPVPGAVKVLKSRISDDPSIVLVDENNDLIPQKLGSCNITTVNTWTYDDGGETLTTDETDSFQAQVVDLPFGVFQSSTLVQFDLPAAPAPEQTV